MGNTPLAGQLPVTVTDSLVTGLVGEQFPELLAGREIGRMYRNDDQVAVRLGDDLGVLLPTSAEFAASFEDAAPWLRESAASWDFPASVPVEVGAPTADFPVPWAVVRWLPGSGASVAYLPPDCARELTGSLRQVHRTAPAEAPASRTTSRALADLADEWTELLDRGRAARGPQGERIDLGEFQHVWDVAVEAPADPPMWTHGAVSPLSVLADNGRFAGICDWLHFGAGDAAVDVAAASLLVPAANALEGRAGYGEVSEAFRARTFGWRHLLMLRWATSDNPFFWRYAWGRILDYGQLADLGVGIARPSRSSR